MKVILTQDIKGTGKKDQIIEVSDGYARNFLFPKKLAVEANAANTGRIEQQRAAQARRKAIDVQAAQDLARRIKELNVTIRAKAGRDGRLFGSVTNKEVSDALKAQHKIEVDKKKVALAEPIKQLGNFTATLHLYAEITTTLNFTVEAIEE